MHQRHWWLVTWIVDKTDKRFSGDVFESVVHCLKAAGRMTGRTPGRPMKKYGIGICHRQSQQSERELLKTYKVTEMKYNKNDMYINVGS